MLNIIMPLPSRFLLSLLVVSFLQPWRLAASTPGTEGFLAYIAEEGARLVDELIDEEISLETITPPLNTIQAAPQATGEMAAAETSTIHANLIIDSPSSSSFSEISETMIPLEESVGSLDSNSIVQVPVTSQNLGEHILALPTELSSNLLSLNFLKSPKAKQTAYMAEHQQAIQKLQTQYPQEKYSEIAQKIVDWKQAIEGWTEYCIPKEKEIHYQNIETLASTMPSELYRLVALSKAMKIMEDATTYSHYFSLAMEKYESDPKKNVYQSYFFNKINTVNNNIEKLEKATDAILSLSEQRNRCLVSAATARAAEMADTPVASTKFEEAATTAQEAIASYSQFAQKMKEGDCPAAFLLRISGFSLEFKALANEYDAQALAIGYDLPAAKRFREATTSAINGAELLEKVLLLKSEGHLKASNAFEQAAFYRFQSVKTQFDQPATTTSNNFSSAAMFTEKGAEYLEKAALAKNEGYVETAKAFTQAANYCFQAAQINFQAPPEPAQETRGAVRFITAFEDPPFYLLNLAAPAASRAAESFKQAVLAKNKGFLGSSMAFMQAAHYQLQVAQIVTQGDAILTKKNLRVGRNSASAAKSLEKEALAKGEGKTEAANAFHQAALTFIQAAEAARHENMKTAEIHEQEAAYYLQRAEVYAQEGKEKGDALTREVYDEELRVSREQGENK